MRTKITILSAVALAAGLVSSSAQVYSANVVGYYNVVTPLGTPGNFKKHLISNQLLGNGNSNQVNVVLQAGLDDSTSQKVDLGLWNGSTFVAYTYYGPTDTGGVPGWYDGFGNYATNILKQGEGAFLVNYSGKILTNTLVGQVVQGPVTNRVTVGFAPYAIVVPVSTNLTASFVNMVSGDAYSQKADFSHFNVALQKFDGALTWYGPIDSGGSPGWYDGFGNNHTTDPAFYPLVGEGYGLTIYGGAPAYNWVSSFTVQ